MNDPNNKVIALTGPTATGKTAFAVRLAHRFNGEIISADSRQVYRGLDVGSGKDLQEYVLPDGSRIPAHLLDVVDPWDDFSLADYLLLANRAIDNVLSRRKLPIVTGGTALYFHAMLSGYALEPGAPDPEQRAELRAKTLTELQNTLHALDPDSETLHKEPSNRTRLIRKIELLRAGKLQTPRTIKEQKPPERDFLILGSYRTRSEVHARIEKRLDQRIADGMLEEAVRLHEAGLSWEKMEFFGLEYRYMALHLQGKMSLQEMRDTLLCKIRQFAKRQDSFFRKLERDGFPIHWFSPEDTDGAANLIRTFLNGKPVPAPEFRLADIRYDR